ncbi:MAG: YfhO family protein, partial [Clostridia bacterium]|nr:YfhO family protein [Clostridia bacterium]
ATVDGNPVDIEKVNVGFMAVFVPGDGIEHTIEFTYTTPGLYMGLMITAFGLVATLIFLLLLRKFGKKEIIADSFIPAEQPEEPEEEPNAEEDSLEQPIETDVPEEQQEQQEIPPMEEE